MLRRIELQFVEHAVEVGAVGLAVVGEADVIATSWADSSALADLVVSRGNTIPMQAKRRLSFIAERERSVNSGP